MNRLFSIVVPVYKVGEYLPKCVESILGQTCSDFEVILVDDGSPDNCPAMCDEYATNDNRVKVVHKANGGLVDARKSGVEVATGRYVICVDGDDFIELTYLEDFKTVIDTYDPDVICCGYYEYREGEQKACHPMKPYGFYDKAKIVKEIFPILIESEDGRYYPPSLWAKAYKRELYQQQQQVSGLVSVGEDHACTKPCIYHADSIYVLDKCLYNYRQNPSSMTKKPKAFSWEGPKAIGQHFERQIDMSQYDFQAQVYRNVVHNLFNVAVSQFNRNEIYTEIKQDIKRNLADPYYQRAIKHCKYKGNLKGSLALAALRCKCYFVMRVFCKIHSF